MTAEGWTIIIAAVALALVQVINAWRQNEKLAAIAAEAVQRGKQVDKIAEDSKETHRLVNSPKTELEDSLKWSREMLTESRDVVKDVRTELTKALDKVADLLAQKATASGTEENNVVAQQAQADADASRPEKKP